MYFSLTFSKEGRNRKLQSSLRFIHNKTHQLLRHNRYNFIHFDINKIYACFLPKKESNIWRIWTGISKKHYTFTEHYEQQEISMCLIALVRTTWPHNSQHFTRVNFPAHMLKNLAIVDFYAKVCKREENRRIFFHFLTHCPALFSFVVVKRCSDVVPQTSSRVTPVSRKAKVLAHESCVVQYMLLVRRIHVLIGPFYRF